MQCVVAVDIGGTNTRIALVNNSGTILRKTSISTPLKDRAEVLAHLIAQTVDEMDESAGLVSVASAGFIKQPDGIIMKSPNFPQWSNVRFKEMLEDFIKRQVLLENDANCALLAEVWLGSAKGSTNVVMLTLGTGVGGACMIDGKLLRGKSGYAGELGHITIDINGHACGCGAAGHLESYCSSYGLKQIAVRFDKKYESIDHRGLPAALHKYAKDGQKDVLDIWSEYGRYLGVGISSLLEVFDPECFILGGGLSKAFDLFTNSMKSEISRRCYDIVADDCRITPAKFADDAGLLGAAHLAFMTLK